jgi:hypothetical protein
LLLRRGNRKLPGTYSNVETELKERDMNFERLARNLGFASAALAIVVGLCATIEYQPVIELLAR